MDADTNNDAMVEGGSGDGGVSVLAAIPGQDPTTVTASGPPITTVTPLNPLVSGLPFAYDPMGNLVVLQVGGALTVTKLNAQLQQDWMVSLPTLLSPSSLNIAPAVDATGNIYVAGRLTSNTLHGMIMQLMPDGTPGWQQTFGPSQASVDVNALAIGSDGTVFDVGGTTGQLANEPAASSGHGFEQQYGTDGGLLLQAQLTVLNIALSSLHVDSHNNSVFLNSALVTKLDSTFTPLWTTTEPSFQGVQTSAQDLAVTPDGTAIFDVEQNIALSPTINLVRRDPSTGAIVWTRNFGTQTATLNAVEGETWTGSFGRVSFMVAANDGVYLTGTYTDIYKNGASPPPDVLPFYVARLDLNGNQVWFKLFTPVNQQVGTGPIPQFLALGAQGQLALDVGGVGIMVISTSDGSILIP